MVNEHPTVIYLRSRPSYEVVAYLKRARAARVWYAEKDDEYGVQQMDTAITRAVEVALDLGLL